VLGNGDIWEAADALRLMRQTGCDGVIVGRGCLGRPWLFRDLADVFEGREPLDPPYFGAVLDLMFQHGRTLARWFGESTAMPSFRRHVSWYTKGFQMHSSVRSAMMQARTIKELEAVFAQVDREQPFPPSAMRVKRGKRRGRQKVSLPQGYLDDLDGALPPVVEAVELASGG
jgi:tRNA-dihydrouridine synthase